MPKFLKKVFILYVVFWLIYGLLPGVLLFWLWINWSPNLRLLSKEDLKYSRNIAIILGVSYWLVSLILWLVAGYVSLAWFMQRSNTVDDFNVEKVENAVARDSNNYPEDHREVSLNDKDEKISLRKDLKSYSSITDCSQNESLNLQRGDDVNLKRVGFRSKSEIFSSLSDMWEDDVLKVPSDPNISAIASTSQVETDKKLLSRRISRQESFKGLPELKSFEDYLHIATINSPLTARELFFIDLIRIADDKERLEALQQLDQSRRPSIELIDVVGACSKAKRDHDHKLESIREVRLEREVSFDDERERDKCDYVETNRFDSFNDKFLPVSKEQLDDSGDKNELMKN